MTKTKNSENGQKFRRKHSKDFKKQAVGLARQADVGFIWCSYATDHARSKGLKPWYYLLIPHDEVKEATDMAGYAAGFTIKPETPKPKP